VTATDAVLRLRTPTWARVWLVVFPIGLACLFLFVIRPQGNLWLGAFVVFVLGPALAWRLFRLAAIGTSDGRLVVRNHWRDRTLHRADVVEVGVERRAGSSNHAVALRLADGSTLRLEVTETPFAGPFRSRLDRDARAVRDWVSGRPQPFL